MSQYMEKTDDNREIQNLKRSIEYASEYLKGGKTIGYEFENKMHEMILELYKPSYQRNFMECRRGNVAGYLKFFLQCVIDQCNAYIYKIERIKDIYKADMKTIETIRGNSVYRIMPVIMKQIVFTKKEVQELSGVSVNVVSNIINQLVELNIIVPDATVVKKGFRYQKIYEVFVGN